MTKIWVIALLGLLLVGCAEQSLYAPMIVEEAKSSEEAAPTQTTTSTGQKQPVPMEPNAEEEAEMSDMTAPTPTSVALPGMPLFNFVEGEPRWFSVDDSVMGGISSSSVFITEPGYLAFSGTMSLEKQRRVRFGRSEWQPVDLSDTEGLTAAAYWAMATHTVCVYEQPQRETISHTTPYSTQHPTSGSLSTYLTTRLCPHILAT